MQRTWSHRLPTVGIKYLKQRSPVNLCPLAGRRSRRGVTARASVGINVKADVFEWSHEGSLFEVPYDTIGKGSKKVLMLPAINLASSRKEFRPLSEMMSGSFTTVTPDWPGFGDSTRKSADYTPQMFLSFVVAFVEQVLKEKTVDVIASGHACGYALQLTKDNPTLWSHMALIAPTFKGPAKAMNMHPITAALLRGAFKTPLLGDLLYNRVIQPSFLKKQYERHVFTDANILTDTYLQEKYETVNKSGGQFAVSHFFTGLLDVVQTRDEYMELVNGLKYPLKVIYGEGSPAKSLAEMQALAEIPDLDVVHCPGSLGLTEECPRTISENIIPFLKS